MRDEITPPLVILPVPPPLPEARTTRELLRGYAINMLATYPARAYEDDLVVRPFYGRQSFLLNAPDDIRRVLIDNDAAYGRTRATIRMIRPLLGERGLFLTRGETWRQQRRATAPAFAPRATAAFARHAAIALGDALGRLDRNASHGVDLLGWLQHLTLDVAGRALFSMPMAEHAPILRRFVLRYGERHSRPSLLDFLLPSAIPSPRDIGRRWFQWRWFRAVDQLIAARERMDVADETPDLFSLLQAQRDSGAGEAFSAAAFRDQIATLIMAGHETTAVALFWSFYLMTLAPDWQEQVAAEAHGVDLSPEKAAAALPSLVVARAVVQEALRLYPPAFIIVRQALLPDRLGAHDVPPGSVMMIAPWVLHRHRKLWQRPEAFDPSRFLPDAPAPDRFAYLPFGAGPRVCIGAPLAMAEATLVLAGTLARYRISLAADRPVLPVGVVTTQPDRPPRFRLEPR